MNYEHAFHQLEDSTVEQFQKAQDVYSIPISFRRSEPYPVKYHAYDARQAAVDTMREHKLPIYEFPHLREDLEASTLKSVANAIQIIRNRQKVAQTLNEYSCINNEYIAFNPN